MTLGCKRGHQKYYTLVANYMGRGGVLKKMSTPALPITQPFIAESFSTIKIGMFAKTRAQYVKI